jgi:2-polyprenyl-3-methyl-5-hydroxy-6-metoxy-1,4-benzoquinol methylase
LDIIDMDISIKQANEETRDVWNDNAEFWDERMGEGNHFVKVLTWPAITQLLPIQPGMRVLDVACGNGLTSRRMAAEGAHVLALDFAEKMIEIARSKKTEYDDRIDYRVIDATDETALLALGENQFDATLCHMALFDMAEIKPLLHALSRLLHPGGVFIFSVLHPCFNNPHVTKISEEFTSQGEFVTAYSVKIDAYLTPSIDQDLAMSDQPRKQLVFHRPLQVLLGNCFETGFVMDALLEPSFPVDFAANKNPLAWGNNFSEIPPALVARMRLINPLPEK